jgi:hypothetical protein
MKGRLPHQGGQPKINKGVRFGDRRAKDTQGRTPMQDLRLLAAIALMAGLMASASARALDESKYPDLKGQWDRVGVPN